MLQETPQLSQQHNKLITLKLQTLVDLCLRDAHSISIDKSTATLIFALTQNKHTCHVQFTDLEYGDELVSPVLWNLHQWRMSTDRWKQTKAWAEKEKIKDWIFKANVDRVAKYIGKKCPCLMGTDASRAIAYGLLKRNNIEGIRAIGCNKLIERQEEL